MTVAALALFAVLPAIAQEKLQPIFDGKTLRGWKQCNGQAKYRVDKGAIVGTTVDGSPNSFLCTEKEYGDFILEYETRTEPALNSGVQIRSHVYASETKVMTNSGKEVQERTHPAGRVHGYQVETATAASGASGGIYDEGRRGWLHNIAADPVASKAFRDNEWNRYRVEAVGDRIRTWINGVPCADLIDSMDLTGFIALQVHSYKGEKPANVSWRNIRIQDMGRHRWKPIFDGRSLSGWSTTGGDWRVEDGAIHAKSDPADERIHFMVSDARYADVTARVRFKMGPGNSGFFVRAHEKTRAAYEVEIDAVKGTGGLYETGGRRWVTGPEDNAAVRKDDWSELIASVHGSRIVFHLNGIKTVDLPNDTQGRKDGRIVLQCHGSKRPTEVWFRDVAILEKER